MTIRKPSHDGYQAHGLSYPSVPSSPVQQNGNLIHNGESAPVLRQGEGKAQDDSDLKRDETNEEYEGELPSSLSFGHGAFTKRPGVATNNVTPSLPIQPIDITPGSSFDSHRSQKSTSPSPEDRYGKSKLASNNPFLQHLDSSASVPMRLIGEESSATIW